MTQKPSNRSRPAGPVHLCTVSSPDEAHARRSTRIEPSGLTIGRDGDWGIADSAMSRRHVTVGANAVAAWVRDLDSKNGTWVNGRKIEGRVEVSLPAVLRVGETVLVVEQEVEPKFASDALVEAHPTYTRCVGELHRSIGNGTSLLLAGLPGSDRTRAAQLGHEVSGRRGRFVTRNASELDGAGVSTAADEAGGGTLFLDDIYRMPQGAQDMLAQILHGRGTMAFIAGDDGSLTAEALRQDLYGRLIRQRVNLPGLGERLSDVARIFERGLRARKAGWNPTLHAELVEALLLCDWRDQERGLNRVVDGVTKNAQGRTYLDLPDLPAELRASVAASLGHEAIAREQLEEAISTHGGNLTRAGRQFSVNRLQMMCWLEGYGIDPSQYAGD